MKPPFKSPPKLVTRSSRMANHAVKYLAVQALTMGASLVTFPIITRLFSPVGYGNFALVNTTIGFIVALSKCGLSTAFSRKYAAFEEENFPILYATSFWSQVAIALVVSSIYVMFVLVVQDAIGKELANLLLVIAPFCILKALEVLFMGFFRNEERIGAFNVAGIAFRLGTAFGGIGLAYFSESGVLGFFVGMLTSEGILIFFLLYQRKNVILPKFVSFSLMKKMVKYGAPLVVFELSSLIMSLGDRYQIRYYLGARPLGMYSAGYNLAMYVQQLLTAPLWMAIFPIYTKTYEHEGREATIEFLRSCLKYYALLAMPLFIGVSFFAKDVILFLAGTKYSAAAIVVGPVLAATLLYGTYHIISAGLYLNNKTNEIAIFTLFAALINLTINIYLIPKYGISGAAYSTVISYLFLISCIVIRARFYLSISCPFYDVALYLFISVMVFYFCRTFASFPRPFFNLLISGFGFLIYFIFMIFYDSGLKVFLLTNFKKLGNFF